MIKRQRPWDNFYDLPARYRLDYLLNGFESEEQALSEDATRVAGILNAIEIIYSDPPPAEFVEDIALMRDLAGRLNASIKSGVHCASLGSSFAMRNLRRSMFSAASVVFKSYADAELIAFTLLNRLWVYTPEQLRATTATKIRDQLRRHLIRAGVHLIPGPLVAYLHGEYDPVARVFVLHFHGMTLLTKKAAVLSMSGKWGYVKTASGADPIKCSVVTDRVKALSYLLKSYWPERAVLIVSGQVERERSARRIGEPYHSFALTWLNQQSPKDLTLLMGCRVGSRGEFVELECV